MPTVSSADVCPRCADPNTIRGPVSSEGTIQFVPNNRRRGLLDVLRGVPVFNVEALRACLNCGLAWTEFPASELKQRVASA